MLINIDIPSGSYNVRVGEDAENFFRRLLGYTSNKKVIVVTDTVVGPLYLSGLVESGLKEGFRVESIQIPAGEESKTLQSARRIYSFLLEKRADRSTPVVALGGGVIGDLAAFAASTFMRGLPFFNIPTTLISQADSAIGGKTGVNLKEGKNLVGTFYQPRYVHIDVNLLETLPEREFMTGLAEVVKHAVISGEEFFLFLEKNASDIRKKDSPIMEAAVYECVKIKGEIVCQDEKEEAGIRKVLNLGHTLGHALEAEAGYGEMTHGEGVALGMVFAAALAEKISFSKSKLRDRIENILAAFSFNTRLSTEIDPAKIIKRMYYDKKVSAGELEFVLPEAIGRVKHGIVVDEKKVKEAIYEILS